MFGRNDKQHWMESDDNDEIVAPFLDPDPSESVKSVAGELRDRLGHLEQQVLAQYTATAAYATLSQQGIETARAEARADLDRSQSTIIGLIDRLRTEMCSRIDGMEARPGLPSTSLALDAASRLAMLEDRMGSMIGALEACVKENILLRQQVDELLQAKMLHDGWLVASGGASQLSLR
jgi:hypothetical protein